ncbi:GH92 family glycosyl hydrolase [Capnocytophaga sp. 051621]|uniref:GH92 family glycosyl hydrolase n=1 Tax=Capnocytophaga periodontitidis TaxID=2795027 RepID=A0ABS0SKP7_9FLAO|nr:GH92 family glycosyl hydrolase [Capnocytophaga periodontitidis]MBI1645839.1 GH92 family glycosyl hydrolase [Capnocytophaga periodontitidis]
MKPYLYLLAFALVACHSPSEQKEPATEQLTNYVNPFIGTDGTGNTYPGAMTPFGMVQLSPDIGIPGWDRISGYFYPDSIITGFSHTHLSGTGAGDLYDVLIMPTNSRFNEHIEANNHLPFSYFSHKHETATAGYYSVDLLSYGIKAELTATPRVGVQRYTFPKDEQSKITVDLGYSINWDKPTETYLKVVDNTTLEGYRFSTGWARNQKVYFVIKLSKPFLDKEFTEEKENGKANRSKMVLRYATGDNETIVVKTALSMHSIAGAYKNMEAEAPHFAFDDYREAARNLWERQLQKITVEGGTEEQKTIFYTMLYQSMLAPNLFSDVDAPEKRYDTFSLWDTFRAAHPLYTLLHREASADFIKSFLAHYRENGTLPVWSMQGGETNMMIGYHAVPIIVDAYFKNIPMDIPLAYEACKQSAMVKEREIDLYQQYGYVPYDLDKSGENWSVSKTLEYAYDDWCIAQFAKSLGKEQDADYFAKRAENWRNLFDKKTTFFRPKDSKGQFIKLFNPKEYSKYFCESNAWHYRWFVPHNILGLRAAMGGVNAFEQKLDSMFTLAVTPDEKLPIFSTGMIGQYVHGNEPSHHVAYLYHFTNHPEKVSQRVTEILNTQYKNTPSGHCGNEDCGQMSSWYVLSALGLYPLNPSDGRYYLTTPLFDKATLHLENGKTFTIEKGKKAGEIRFNGKPFHRNYINYDEILTINN